MRQRPAHGLASSAACFGITTRTLVNGGCTCRFRVASVTAGFRNCAGDTEELEPELGIEDLLTHGRIDGADDEPCFERAAGCPPHVGQDHADRVGCFDARWPRE